MLLQRIRLKGFLGHRGSANGDSGDGFVEVDFSTAPLWLIHGSNGAGKSSLWDAVTFTLFKKHRASGTDSGKNLRHLVHDECPKAEVVVEFDLDGQPFRVCGEILKPKRKNGSASTSRIVQRRDSDGWRTVAEGEQKTEDWLTHNLRISFETFTSAVLLRQGEADSFLKAKAKDRRARLMELLRLDFYRKLGTLTESRRLEKRRSYSVIEKALAELPVPSDEDLSAQKDLIENLRRHSEELQLRRTHKEEEERNALQAKTLLEQITGCEIQRQKDQALFDQATRIEVDVARFYELRDVLLRLDNLWAARSQLEREESRLKDELRDMAEIESRLSNLVEAIQQKSKAERLAAEHFQRTKEALEEARQYREAAVRRAQELTSIEALEQEITAEEAKLTSYQPTLSRRREIERAFERHEELREAISLLKPLAQSAEDLRKAQLVLNEKEAAVALGLEESRRTAEAEEHLQREFEVAETRKENLRAEQEDCRANLNLLRDKVKRRDEVSGESECPYCGSTLSDEDVKGRLAAEHAGWHAEIAHLESEETRLAELLEASNRTLSDLRKKQKAAGKASREASSTLEGVRRDREHATAAATTAQQELESSHMSAGAWATRLQELPQLEVEFTALGSASTERHILNEALIKEREVGAAVSVLRRQLSELPSVLLTEREQVVRDAENSEQRTIDCEAAKDGAESAFLKATQELRGLTNDQLRFSERAESTQRSVNDQQHRVHESRQRYEQAKADISPTWLSHSACEDARARSALKQEMDGLSGSEVEAQELLEARERKSRLEGSISAFRQQLDAIPHDHLRPVEDVQAELASLKKDIAQTGTNLGEAGDRLTELLQQRSAIEGKLTELAEAERELNYFNRLAEALGKSGLEAVIVRKAQEEIRQRANETLTKLSSGCLEIDLVDKTDSEELQIQARDLRTGSLRLFEYLSGGEKFRVAISLAVAIGQTISGGRAAETLIIDEGFGALDEVNRGLLVQELSRVSNVILRGGRIVIVSHQDDVCEDFTHRYRITKDGRGYVSIECGTPD